MYQLINGDCIEVLKTLDEKSVQCVVTSPPYFGLRDYGTDGQIGLEPTPDEFVQALVEVFRQVHRVLRDDGTVWLNLGDSYASYRDGKATPDTTRGDSSGTLVPKGSAKNRMASTFAGTSIKHKDLIGIPWRVAFALQDDGWYLRQDIIWHKPNPMPESVRDRCTKAHEYIFLLTKSAKYYYDNEAIKEEAKTTDSITRDRETTRLNNVPGRAKMGGLTTNHYTKKNKRSVWTVTTKPYKGAHFATYPPELIEPCILAGTKAGDVVLDPFNGSGTTGAVALTHGRQYVGIDLNEEYLELAEQRISDAITQSKAPQKQKPIKRKSKTDAQLALFGQVGNQP